MNLVNLIKTVKNLAFGKSMSPVSIFLRADYPLLWPLRPSVPRIDIHCFLCGFPRTGTHWIRNVIEKSAAQKTYDIHDSKPAPGAESVLLVKIHARNKLIARAKALLVLPPHKFRGKYIYTYRDPRDAIISLYEMYKKSKDLSGLQARSFLQNYDPIRQYRWEINAWVLRRHKDVLLVKFEDLKLKTTEGFKRIFSFLDLRPEINKEYTEEIVAASDNKNRPRGAAYGWKSAPAEYGWLIDQVTRELAKEIEWLGYDDG